MFLHLPVDQTRCDLPSKGFTPTTSHLSPVSKMSGECIEVHIEAITGENWETARSQTLSQRVNEPMRRLLRTRTELKHRDDLGEGIDGQPQPEDLCGAAQSGSQFVQLQVREVQVAETALMEELCVPACA